MQRKILGNIVGKFMEFIDKKIKIKISCPSLTFYDRHGFH